MKRIWKSIGLAVLLAALLVGTGSADVGPVKIDGCLIPSTYFSLGAGTVANLDLGMLPTLAAGVDGGDLEVVAGDDYTVTVADTGAAGKMALATTGSSPLTNAFQVKSGATTAVLAGSATPKDLATGNVNTDCDPQEIEVIYIQDDVTGGVYGEYTISLTFAGSLDGE